MLCFIKGKEECVLCVHASFYLLLLSPPQAGAELGKTLTTESHFPSLGNASGESSEPLWRKQTRETDGGP